MALKECTPIDYPKLVEFWNSNADWDVIDIETWKNRFLSSPDGNSFVVVAEKDGDIQAQLIFVSLSITSGKEFLLASRPYAAVIGKKYRGIFGYKFMLQLFNFGIQQMRKKKFDLLIMLPDPRWRRLAPLIDIQVFSFPLFKLELSDETNFVDTETQTRFIDYDDIRIDSLWNEISDLGVIMINRSREFLKWKNSHRDYKIIGVFQNDLLIGLTTFLEKERECQIQICDLLFFREFEESVVHSVTGFLSDLYINDSRFNKVVCLMTESLKSTFSEEGYEYGDYDFYFGIKVLNPNLSKDVVTISNWYLSAND